MSAYWRGYRGAIRSVPLRGLEGRKLRSVASETGWLCAVEDEMTRRNYWRRLSLVVGEQVFLQWIVVGYWNLCS
jgi:hypothetical protein